MFRRARWLLPVAILAIAGFTLRTYLDAKRQQKLAQPKAQTPLADNVAAKFDQGWTYKVMDGDRVKVLLRAQSIEMVKEPSNYHLKGVEIRLYKKEGDKYNLITTPEASFDTASGMMYSDSEAEISMNREEDETAPKGRIVKIWASGVTFETKTNLARTERPTRFELDTGTGRSTGATYDSAMHELHLLKDVELTWHGKDAKAPPMNLQTGMLTYKEVDSLILMGPWAKMTRGKFTLESGNAYVFLKDGAIARVEARDAKGTDVEPGRRLDYQAPNLNVTFNDKTQVEKVDAEQPAHLVSTTAASVTTMDAHRMDLEFTAAGHDSLLKKALATGKARIENKPVARPGVPAADTRVLASETIEMFMREGGKDMEKVLTHAPGTLEFLPNRPGPRKRRLEAERMTMNYAPGNNLQSFLGVTARTRSEGVVKGKPVVTLTSSRMLTADFDPRSGQMTQMEQIGDFTYEEGTRKAKCDTARMDQSTEVMRLSRDARVWDETGSTAADDITIDQRGGTMAAAGNVSSTRLPDAKKKASGAGLLDGSQPMQARAATMFVSDDNKKVRYDGNAVLWQGARRLTASNVTLDSAANRLEARGGVTTELPDAEPPAGSKTRAGFSKVRAQELDYDDGKKVAHYRGGVTLERPTLELKSRELQAFFREEKTPTSSETKLDHLFAEGASEFVERKPSRTVRGGAERTEYWLQEERLVLTGGAPYLVDSQRGSSRGARIEYWQREDRLKVDNTGSGPAVSRITTK